MKRVTLTMDDETYQLLVDTAKIAREPVSAHLRDLIRRQQCTPCFLGRHGECEHQTSRRHCACPHPKAEAI
jgi:hypothetical protein